MFAFVFLFALACVANASTSNSWPAGSKPWFCHKLDCPFFTRTNVTNSKAFETRSYPAYVWSSTLVSGHSLDLAETTGFQRLFAYIQGANKNTATIEMASPVTAKVVAGQGPQCDSNFTVSFFFPDVWQAKPNSVPVPTNKAVYTGVQAARNVAVLSFGGYARQSVVLANVQKLQTALDAAGLAYEPKHFWSVGYDSPFHIVGRHNEIWLELK